MVYSELTDAKEDPMKPSAQLLIIDPQNDFCDLPAAWRPVDPLTGAAIAPALPVAGAHADMQRLAALIRAAGAALDDITITLDSHHRVDIAHPTFWQQRRRRGRRRRSRTITAAQVRAGEFQPRDPAALPRALAYLDELEVARPLHADGVAGALRDRHLGPRRARRRARRLQRSGSRAQLRGVRKVTKGKNPWTEHYSAIQAEVPDADDAAHADQHRAARRSWTAPTCC